MAVILTQLDQWIEQSTNYLKPPICNRMLYQDGQLKVFVVGGPNERKDFHLEEGEEFFYQLKGEVVLVTVQNGRFEEIHIREGEVFLLPTKTLHSPQRKTDTIGIVAERQRNTKELDSLRYFIDGSTEILYERWFHCKNLGKDLGPIIQEYMGSEAKRTGRPQADSLEPHPPYKAKEAPQIIPPFKLKPWIETHRNEIISKGRKTLFEGDFVSQIEILGPKTHSGRVDDAETMLWQLEGESELTVNEKVNRLVPETNVLIAKEKRWQLENRGFALLVILHPKKINWQN